MKNILETQKWIKSQSKEVQDIIDDVVRASIGVMLLIKNIKQLMDGRNKMTDKELNAKAFAEDYIDTLSQTFPDMSLEYLESEYDVAYKYYMNIGEKYIARIPKIGCLIDHGPGQIIADDSYQRRKIEEAKESWKRRINTKRQVYVKCVADEQWKEHGKSQKYENVPYLGPNPYYGWKEDQLAIIVE